MLGGSADPADRPPNVVRTYGLTETGGGIAYDGLALPGVEVDVIDGEICVRSATLARGRRQTDGTVSPSSAPMAGCGPAISVGCRTGACRCTGGPTT